VVRGGAGAHVGELMEREDEAHGRDRALAPGLPPPVQRRQLGLLPKLDEDFEAVLFKVVLPERARAL
jgi:hypothetical protein